MLTLDVMRNVELSADPLTIRFLGGIARTNYLFPPTRTKVEVEGEDNVPWDRSVIFAMNHTDRFNYIPFFVWLLRNDRPSLCTWVKGKYYQNTVVRKLLVSANQIPVPSRGYLITADAVEFLGRPPSEEAYRLIRGAIDSGETDLTTLRAEAVERDVDAEVTELFETPRDMLGYDFDPRRENYVEAQIELFRLMIDEFVGLNVQAFRLGCNVLVFPEGTRSPRLSKGRTGLAQMALRLGAPVVPVGCNGSDDAYPGANPLSRGGEVRYRIGEALMPDAELAEFQIDAAYHPFTREASEKYVDKFEAMTELVMDRINILLDPEYQRSEDDERLVRGTRRFV
ncbi:lysophospholipid acyltransferase family protein [Persicimonas caeni]|uniref:lysophospholipid acyltransferase family protein n=1 Tax=Persicimonas caeni TaxID=2292766 RepID=UPI001C9AB333|nr:lysophospholipid acyltransferase family protein [Persicimonas caeni]